MQTLRQLMDATPGPVRSRARGQCSGTLTIKDQAYADKLRGRKGTLFRELRFNVTCTTGVRSCVIRFYGGGKIRPSAPVWVTCSCPFWKYYCEVAVAATGSSTVVHSNGAAPKVRNPSMTPMLCKHLFKVGVHGLEALKETNLPDSFFYEQQRGKKSRELLDQRSERYIPPLEGAAKVVWSKPIQVSIPPGLAEKLGRKP